MANHKGGRLVGNLFNGDTGTVLTRRFIVTSGVTITKGDFVYFASGRITNSDAGSALAGKKLLGCANETQTGTSGSIFCEVIIAQPGDLYLVDNDNLVTTFALTHVGQYFDLVGGTGAQLVDTSTVTTSPSASTGSLVCIDFNPQVQPYESTTTMGSFMIAKPFYLGFTA